MKQSSRHYAIDTLGASYQYTILELAPDHEGSVIATLIRKQAHQKTKKAVLYIHGFVDYFFQTEMADHFNAQGYDFYALDLRKYGRSHLAHQTMYQVQQLTDYDEEISLALHIIADEGHDSVLLSGHSTGGLITTLYAARHAKNPIIKGLWLNSPFYDFNMTTFEKKHLVPRIASLGKKFPDFQFPSRLNKWYVPSLHKIYHGEWLFNLEWKKPSMPLVALGFVTAIHEAQKQLHQGIELHIPTLLMHSHQTKYPLRFNLDAQTSDVILNIKDMIKHSQSIQADLELCEIHNGLHDLVLSQKNVREKVYHSLFDWLKRKAI